MSLRSTPSPLTLSIAIDRVDQQYRKSLEPKPEPEKAARPKSGGKPAKVYPTFDISPRVAKEFLERLKQEESKPIVDFQKDEERYTTWKNMEIQEEQEKQKQKSAEGKPATFAAALLAKLNISEAPAELPKGQYLCSASALSLLYAIRPSKTQACRSGSWSHEFTLEASCPHDCS